MSTLELLRSTTPVLRVHDSGLIGPDASPYSSCQAGGVSRDEPYALIADDAELVGVNLETGELHRHKLRGESTPKSIVGLTGRRFVVVSILDAHMYDLADGKLRLLREWDEFNSGGSVLQVAATPDASRIAIAAGDRVWEGSVKRKKLTSVIRRHKELSRYAVALSDDGQTLVCGGPGGATVHTGRPPGPTTEVRFPDSTDIPLLATGLSPDGELLAVGDDITRTALCDLSTGDLRPLDTSGKAIAIDWLPDGSGFAVVTLTREIYVFDREGQPVAVAGHPDSGTRYFYAGGWLPDGTGLWAATEHGLIVTWNFA
ncbi:WD40 repeat domain-containing protein [Phytomonospora sp. NPDC050363]|uniref:WD40 repeat domain-containing protein n=1 Tax=Phytomonospora sp. NPDC050363 TaxID=3155642 RepID=UPI0033C23767